MTDGLTTAVIGAGPAGLLFTVVGRILAEKRGVADAWRVRLFDKRDAYARTHRLRMDPVPYLEIQRDLGDARFDTIVSLLRESDFAPEVNVLEDALVSLASALGVHKEKRDIDGLDSLRALREEVAPIDADVTIVGADSVHSTVRALTFPATSSHVTHERLARLRVRGASLPAKLGLLDRIRLSKVLGSILDYRLNRNGYAEVDLFLAPAEHDAVRALGATPRSPVAIRAASLSRLRAPLFRALVEHLESGLGAPCEVEVHSTFELEHRIAPRLVARNAELHASIFLLGDAGISLPFLRGMACLASSAHALAHAHVDRLVSRGEGDLEAFHARHPRPIVGVRPLPGRIVEVHATSYRGAAASVIVHRWIGRWGVHVVREDGATLRALRSIAPVGRGDAREAIEAHVDLTRRYDHETRAIANREIRIVRSRAWLVHAAREAFRVAAMLPFPIQTWLLRAPELHDESDRATPGLLINAAIAVLAATIALSASALDAMQIAHPAWLAWLALPVELVGGASFRAALALEAPPHRWVARVWAVQIAALFLAGLGLAAPIVSNGGWIASLPTMTWWLSLAAVFVIGMLAFERVASRVLRAAELS